MTEQDSNVSVGASAAAPVVALGRFANPGDLLQAARKTREAGYKDFETYSPFAIHGMDDATGEKQSPLGWIVGLMALVGGSIGLGLQWWASVVEYPLVISGKPLFSFQAFVPITFELTILLSAFAAVLGMLALNGLPRLYHPLFNSKNFALATDHGFFLGIDATDQKFDSQATTGFLSSIGATEVEYIYED